MAEATKSSVGNGHSNKNLLRQTRDSLKQVKRNSISVDKAKSSKNGISNGLVKLENEQVDDNDIYITAKINDEILYVHHEKEEPIRILENEVIEAKRIKRVVFKDKNEDNSKNTNETVNEHREEVEPVRILENGVLEAKGNVQAEYSDKNTDGTVNEHREEVEPVEILENGVLEAKGNVQAEDSDKNTDGTFSKQREEIEAVQKLENCDSEGKQNSFQNAVIPSHEMTVSSNVNNDKLETKTPINESAVSVLDDDNKDQLNGKKRFEISGAEIVPFKKCNDPEFSLEQDIEHNIDYDKDSEAGYSMEYSVEYKIDYCIEYTTDSSSNDILEYSMDYSVDYKIDYAMDYETAYGVDNDLKYTVRYCLKT